MKRASILLKLTEIIHEIIGNQNSINEDTKLIGQGIMDSMDFMNYITRVENEFGIKIDNNAINQNQLGIVKQMIDYILSVKS
jgi:acyl carrier protein